MLRSSHDEPGPAGSDVQAQHERRPRQPRRQGSGVTARLILLWVECGAGGAIAATFFGLTSLLDTNDKKENTR